MKFINPSPSLQEDLHSLWDTYNDLATHQREQWRYLPLIITGKSWTGKDTVWQATQKILEEDFWLDFPYCRSRYLTRKMRPWEEDSHLNFISEADFEERQFVSRYRFAENLYGLDFSWAQDELNSQNIAIMNSYPDEITRIFDMFFSTTSEWNLPALIISLTLDFWKYHDFLHKRWWAKQDIERRLNDASRINTVWQMYKRLSRYKHYNHSITVEPSDDDSKNQENFNRNVIDTINTILRHMQKYLEMSPAEIQAERVDFHQRHRDSRP